VIREYLTGIAGRKRSYNDDKRYGDVWSKRFAGLMLDEVTSAELEKVRTDRLAASWTNGKEKPRAISPATVNREFAFLKHVYNIAVRDGKTESNPVSKLRMLRESSGRVRYLSDDEEQRLMKVLPTDADRQRVTVLLHTGFRRVSSSGSGHLEPPSTPLDATALVFPNTEANRDLRWAKKIVPAALRAAKIDDFRFHDLRHTFASRLAMEASICSRSRNSAAGRVCPWCSGTLISRPHIAAPQSSAS